MKTVGADLYIRPKVASYKTVTALRHKIMVYINLMDECINRVSTLHSGGYINPPLQFYGILFQQPRIDVLTI